MTLPDATTAPARTPPPRAGDHGLDPVEREGLARDGYVVREAVLPRVELDQVRAACEDLVERLCAHARDTPKVPAGSYCFQVDPDLCSVVKWEPDRTDVVQGVEPFAHFDPVLRGFGLDPRFVDPMRDLIDAPEVELFTEKLNVKRARVGGPIVLHQDYPYWVANSVDPADIATAVLFLDDATRENGCIEVLPGSHRDGVRAGGSKSGFGEFEMDPAAVRDDELVSLEVPAGSVVFFGSLLVHRSAPNRTDGDRRTLLYSYQPAGRPHAVVALRKLLERRARAR